jgi:hypothetical protein
MVPKSFRYSQLWFLQVMLAIAWSAFAQPFSATVIELELNANGDRIDL